MGIIQEFYAIRAGLPTEWGLWRQVMVLRKVRGKSSFAVRLGWSTWQAAVRDIAGPGSEGTL